MPRRKPAPRAWNEHNDQEWVTLVTTTFERHDADEVVTYRGLCPICLDEIAVVLASDEIAACNCGGDHPGRPADRSGCGVYGYVSELSASGVRLGRA